MKNLKHTPAPWKIFIKAGTMDACRIKDAQKMLIADCFWMGENKTKEEAEANAKLIASAHELLEALILANKLITGFVPAEGDDHIKIKNAIKKATE